MHLTDERIDQTTRRLLAYRAGDGPLSPLDDLAAQRLVAAVLSDAEEPTGRPTSITNEEPGFGRRAWAVALVTVVTVVAATAMLLGLLWLRAPTPRHPLIPDAVARPTGAARLLLRTGIVGVDGRASAVGDEPAAGALISVRTGRTALGLSNGARLLLGTDTRLRLSTLPAPRSGSTRLTLQKGSLLVTLPPRPRRAPFWVETPAGRVEVTGTIFRIRIVADCRKQRACVTVVVFRGQVRLHEPGYGRRLLERGSATYLRRGEGARVVWKTTAGAQKSLALEVRILERLQPRVAGRLQIRTTPTGAAVLLDGVRLGRTPLTAAVRPGRHRLRVQLAGHAPVHEELAVAVRTTVRRTLSLHRLRTVPPSPVPAERPRPPQAQPSGLRPDPRAHRSTTPVQPPPAPPPPVPIAASVPPSARVLLGRARTHSAAREFAQAAHAYRRLLRLHPAAPQARVARLSLGLILLDHLSDPRGALRLFNTYLIRVKSGALAQEAAYSRIRALRRLGRQALERTAIRNFVRRFPQGLQTPLLRKRLRSL